MKINLKLTPLELNQLVRFLSEIKTQTVITLEFLLIKEWIEKKILAVVIKVVVSRQPEVKLVLVPSVAYAIWSVMQKKEIPLSLQPVLDRLDTQLTNLNIL